MTDTTTTYPSVLPDELASKIGALAKEHGYVVEKLTLTWAPSGMLRVHYDAKVDFYRNLDGTPYLKGGLCGPRHKKPKEGQSDGHD